MKKNLLLALIAILCLCLPSCRLLYPNAMFKEKNYQYFELAQKQVEEYVIQPSDQFTIKIYSRDGFKLVDISESQGNTTIANNGMDVTFAVDGEGFVNLPIIGNYYVKGFTETELERILEDKYSSLFVDPYVVVRVTNRRAFIFKGSLAAVVSLNQSPTTLIEVIAKSGGVDKNLKAYKIKLIRGDLKNPEIKLIDLSTIDGLRNADLIVQSNDIIYIEERKRIAVDILRETTPILSLLTSIITLSVLLKTIGK
jgi:polysaccharide export outer membrane protein